MAVSHTMTWELRGSSGSDNNGGGFKPGASGTDYSQQNSAQYALTGLTSSGAGAVILTASAASDMVGNAINITGGTNFTTGIYEITSVSAGVSITVDRNCTTGAGASGTANVGGALATVAKAYGAASTGNTFWLKGTITETSTLTLSNLQTDSSGPVMSFFGYGSTRGDGTHATWTTATNSTDLIVTSGNLRGYLWRSITLSNTASTRARAFHATGGSSAGMMFDTCTFDGFSQAFFCNFNVDWGCVCALYNCEIKNCTAEGYYTSDCVWMFGCYVHDNAASGLRVTWAAGDPLGHFVNVANSVFYNNGAEGVYIDQEDSVGDQILSTFQNCAFTNNTNSGLRLGNTATTVVYNTIAVNSIFYGNGAYGINYLSAIVGAQNKVLNCAFGANSTAAIHNFTGAIGTVTLTGDPFNGRTSADYSLNSTAGAGAACRAAGMFGVSLFGTGYPDIGPLQHQDSGGGSSGMLYIPNLEGT